MDGSVIRAILRNSLVIVSVTALAMTLCQCQSSTDKVPDIPMPDSWQQAGDTTNPVNLPIYAWWRVFDCPELNRYVDQAMRNNMDLATALLRVRVAQQELKSIKLGWLPSLAVITGHSSNTINIDTSILPISLSGAASFLAIMPRYTKNIFEQIALQKESAANVILTKTQQDAVRQIVQAEVVKSYLTLLAQDQLLRQLAGVQNQLSELKKISYQAYKGGLISELPYLSTKNSLDEVDGLIQQTKQNRWLAQSAINRLRHLPPQHINLTSRFDQIAQSIEPPGNLPVSVINARPDVAQSMAVLLMSQYSKNVVRALLLPSISFEGLFTHVKNSAYGANLSTSGNITNISSYIDITPEKISGQSVAVANEVLSLQKYQKTVNYALHDVENAFVNHHTRGYELNDEYRADHSLSTQIQLIESQYQQGLVSYDILLAKKIERAMLGVDITESALGKSISLVRIFQEMGAGSQYQLPDKG